MVQYQPNAISLGGRGKDRDNMVQSHVISLKFTLIDHLGCGQAPVAFLRNKTSLVGHSSQSCLQGQREGQEDTCLERRVFFAVNMCSAHKAISVDNALPLARTGHFK